MGQGPDAVALAYCAGRDVIGREAADARLIPWDIWTNRAHAVMLRETGILPAPLANRLFQALDTIEQAHGAGEFHLNPELEDVHINIEAELTRLAGPEAGGRIHTARSRNDQSATDMRLWLRDRCLNLRQEVASLIAALLDQAERRGEVVIPGYTHAQPAALTTWGHWLLCWAQGFVRDAQRLEGVSQRLDCCPLGAAASFGSSWEIDRRLTAELLGFSAVQENTLDCITTRWEMEADLGQAVAFVMTRLSQMGQDLLAFSTPPGDILRLDDRFTTGSSIMPQKRNPDFAEVTRARAASVQSLAHTLMEVARGARSGYNRDTQWTKYWIMDLMDEAEGAPLVFAAVTETCRFHPAVLETMIARGFMNAVDVADFIARRFQAPFRECYHALAETVRLSYEKGALDFGILNDLLARQGLGGVLSDEEIAALSDPVRLVASRGGEGGCAPEAVAANRRRLAEALEGLEKSNNAHREAIAAARDGLRRRIDGYLAEV